MECVDGWTQCNPTMIYLHLTQINQKLQKVAFPKCIMAIFINPSQEHEHVCDTAKSMFCLRKFPVNKHVLSLSNFIFRAFIMLFFQLGSAV